MRPNDLDVEYLNGRWLHVTGITPALSESCREAVEQAIELGRAAGLEVSFDPNMRLKLWTVEQAREVMFPLIRRSTILLGGMEELSLLLQVDNPDAAADWALEQGLSIAAIKLGRTAPWWRRPPSGARSRRSRSRASSTPSGPAMASTPA